MGTDTDLTGSDEQLIRSRERVRDIAEVYTHRREVDAMLDLVPGMFPSEANLGNTDRTFLEPSCGSGNFLVEILRRKLVYVTTHRYGGGERFEFRVLRCLASIYGVDICRENVATSRDRLRATVSRHMNGFTPSAGFSDAVEVVLGTNVIRADMLTEAGQVEVVEYVPVKGFAFRRVWFPLESGEPDLFTPPPVRDGEPVHYAKLPAHPGPVPAPADGAAAGREGGRP